MVRENSIIATSGDHKTPSWRLLDEVTLQLFQIADGAEISVRLVASDNTAATHITCRRMGAQITLTSDGRARNVRVLLRSIPSVTQITNGKLLADRPEGPLVEWMDTTSPIVFSVSASESVPGDRAGSTRILK